MQSAAGTQSGIERHCDRDTLDPYVQPTCLQRSHRRHGTPRCCSMRIVILHTLPPESPGKDRTVHEFDLSGPATFVAKCLRGSMVRAVRGWPGEIMDVL